MNKKAIKILIVSVIVAVIVGGTIAGIVVVNLDRKKEKLVVYNWADYIDPANITLFEEYYKQKTGKEIEVVYSTFDTNETMMTEVTKGDSQIDLVCPSEYSIQKLKEKNQSFHLFARYDYYDSMFRYDKQPTDMYAWCGRHRAAVGINYFPIKQIGVKAEFSYGILKQGTRADGTRGKLYNDEPQIAIGIVYAGFYQL